MMWHFDAFAGNTAVIADNGTSLTYAQLAEQAQVLAGYIPRRSLVFCLSSNSIGSLLGYVAFLQNGIVPLMLDVGIASDRLDNLLAIYRPQYLWLPETHSLPAKGATVYRHAGYCLVQLPAQGAYPLHPELALLLSTSGSTGSPKLVRQTYANIEANTTSICQYLKIVAEERPITTLPMHYVYGLSIINTHLRVGATLLLTDKSLMQREFWDFFAKESATSFGGVPYTYQMLDRLQFFRRKLPTLRTMTQAGGKLDEDLHRKFARYATDNGKKFVIMYGAAEATSRMGWLPPKHSLEKCGAMGVAIPGGRFAIMDEQGEEIATADRTGELVYHGANVTPGYALCGADLAKGDERHGVLHTGDLAQRDADGFYYIVGRKSRFLKLYGNRVGLDETEQMLRHQWPGQDFACTGHDDALHVFVTDATLCESVKTFLAQTLHINPVAFHAIAVDALPRNGAGKIQYAQLERMHD